MFYMIITCKYNEQHIVFIKSEVQITLNFLNILFSQNWDVAKIAKEMLFCILWEIRDFDLI